MHTFEETGAAVIRNRIPPALLDAAREIVDDALAGGQPGAAGARAFSLPASPGAANSGAAGPHDLRTVLTGIAAELAGRPVRLVRILAFDKTPASNWGVQWHQDRTIAVRRRADVPGFGPWSEKAGTPHVEPPQAMLEQMLTLRLHIDDCGSANGPLKVVPGSHRLGRVPARKVLMLGLSGEPMVCTAGAGDIVAMKALTVHASSPAETPGHRRVLHLDFSAADLPPPLEWAVE